MHIHFLFIYPFFPKKNLDNGMLNTNSKLLVSTQQTQRDIVTFRYHISLSVTFKRS